MEIRFGELIDEDEDERGELMATVSLLEHGDTAQDLEESQQESDSMLDRENMQDLEESEQGSNRVVSREDVQDLGETQQESNGIVNGDDACRVRRAGFGTAQDVLSLSGIVRMRRNKSAEPEAQ
jgi:hypothetical protein